MDADIIIGLEVHVQLNTRTKLFCSCPTTAEEPNTAICPTCLGHPGSKPAVNEAALEHATKLALALGCTIAPTVTFSRKTYFYPDLSKNYQITQHEIPLGKEGHVALNDKRAITLKRVHLEEDPGALIREAGHTLVDYNRSGIPLCEIVTEPDLHSPAEAREFMKKLLNILGYLGIYNPDGVIKADANVSIKEKQYTRVEIKNITGFKEIERALTYEIQRQKEQDVAQETRGWNAEKGITYSMRTKEAEEDYGYIIEPDLPVFEISKDWIRHVKEGIPELAEERAKRWVAEWNIDETDATIIAANIDVAELFEHIAERVNPVLASHWVRREVLRVLNDQKKELRQTKFRTQELIELFELLEENQITQRIGQRIIEKLAEEEFSPKEYVEQEGLTQVSDKEKLKEVCQQAIKENQQAVDDYRKGEQKALQFLIGKVMRKTKGTAAPNAVKDVLRSLLE